MSSIDTRDQHHVLNDSFSETTNNPFYSAAGGGAIFTAPTSPQPTTAGADAQTDDADHKSDSAASSHSKAALLQQLEEQRDMVVQRLQQLASQGLLRIFPTVHSGSASRLQLLLAHGIVSVAERDANGSTPLHVAASKGDDEIVTILLSYGSDVSAMDRKGRTARDLAHLNGHSYVARILDFASRNAPGGLSLDLFGPSATMDFNAADEFSPQASDIGTAPPGASEQRRDHKRSFSNASGGSVTTPGMGPLQGVLNAVGGGGGETHTPTNPFPSAVIPIPNTSDTSPGAPTGVGSSNADGVGHSPPTPSASSSKPRYVPSRFSTVSDTVSVVICMVGLPGRGKSFISNHLRRYLNWKGVPCQVFNAGNYRRQILGAACTGQSDFYGDDPKTVEQRERMAELACADVVSFINGSSGVSVAVLDATNTTFERRAKLITFFKKESPNARLLWIESVCDSPNVIRENILRAKFGGEDFTGITDPNAVLDDFYKRIAKYQSRYQTIDPIVEPDLSFIRIINVKETVQLHNVNGVIAARVAYFLLNLHPVAHPIYICRHAETVGDVNDVFGGDEELTPAGARFAEALRAFVEERGYGAETLTVVYANTSQATKATVQPLLQRSKTLPDWNVAFEPEDRALSEINFGNFTLGTSASVRKHHPKRFERIFERAVPPLLSIPPKAQVIITAEPNKVTYSTEVAPSVVGTPATALTGGNRFHPPSSAFQTPLALAGATLPPTPATLTRNKYPAYNEVFPRGESTRMVAVRCEDVILRISRASGPLLIVCPDTPARVLLSYLADIAPEQALHVRLPMHGIVEVGPKGDMTVDYLLAASPSGGGACP